ncbi:uncharacterized protein LOC132611054 isoform X1 [Lycium barbarum]|uniref:uncharacterized protein LOC132611054 isoform X1 n=1 Tax=Lycium barbarum TaxID=112863 RepID=UPI00293E3BC4|nr:uncharacterized protein LOC132611054 isoform X1 [Lycium barbarum]
MRFPPRLAEAHTNSKILSKTSDKIETIQRKLEHSMQKCGASIDVQAGNVKIFSQEKQKKLKKLLMNVNIQNSLGPLHVVMSSENTVGDFIKAVIEIYLKEKRRPLLPSSDARCYELHYSQFSLDTEGRPETASLPKVGVRSAYTLPSPDPKLWDSLGLKPEEKLLNLESRSFFLCPKPNSSFMDKAKATAKLPVILAKFMDLFIQIVINLSSFWPKCHPHWL